MLKEIYSLIISNCCQNERELFTKMTLFSFEFTLGIPTYLVVQLVSKFSYFSGYHRYLCARARLMGARTPAKATVEVP